MPQHTAPWDLINIAPGAGSVSASAPG